MNSISISFVQIVAVVMLAAGCAPQRVPVPAGAIPSPRPLSSAERSAGEQMRRGLLQQFREAPDYDQRQRVERIFHRLLLEAGADPRNWRLTVLDDPRIVNAAATRGNQVFVWTGLLRELESDDQLAAVLAHEIAHVLTGHVEPTPQETINRVLAQVAGGVVGGALARGGGGQLGAQVGGALTQQTVEGFIVNPYSRSLELEADQVGVFLMADAGYDPRAALHFFQRAEGSPGKLLQFFSTHPTSPERIARIEDLLPSAMRRYRGAQG